jgi:hypothetical protein
MKKFCVLWLSCLVFVSGCSKKSTSPEETGNNQVNQNANNNPQQVVTTQEAEPNNSADSCNLVTNGQAVVGVISSSSDKDWYKLRFDNRGSYEKIKIAITNTASTLETKIRVYNSNRAVFEFGGLTTHYAGSEGADLYCYPVLFDTAVYVEVFGNGDRGSYTITLGALGANDDYEPNETRANAYDLGKLPMSGPINGVLLSSVENDWFKFTSDNRGIYDIIKIAIDSTSSEYECDYHVYNATGSELFYAYAMDGGDLIRYFSTKDTVFFVQIGSWNGMGKYHFMIQCLGLNDSYEPNEAVNFATDIGGVPVDSLVGRIVNSDEADWYTFTADSGYLDMTVRNMSMDFGARIYLYDQNKVQIGMYVSANAGANISASKRVSGGRYYIKLVASSFAGVGAYKYTLILKTR